MIKLDFIASSVINCSTVNFFLEIILLVFIEDDSFSSLDLSQILRGKLSALFVLVVMYLMEFGEELYYYFELFLCKVGIRIEAIFMNFMIDSTFV